MSTTKKKPDDAVEIERLLSLETGKLPSIRLLP